MKPVLALILTLGMLFALCACGEEEKTDVSSAAETDSLPIVLDSNEYNLYQNIFYNQMGEEYAGQSMTKTGVFTSIYDSFNQVTRYYVWGYYDQTKCCDWQWEFVPEDPTALPAIGSLVEMTGTFCADEAALDGYWFIDTSLHVKTAYEASEGEIDMCTMSATLERVQLINMQMFPEEYEGKTVRVYGRVYSPTEVQHPYYDNAWTQPFSTNGSVPAIGSVVIVSGNFSKGEIMDASITETSEY